MEQHSQEKERALLSCGEAVLFLPKAVNLQHGKY